MKFEDIVRLIKEFDYTKNGINNTMDFLVIMLNKLLELDEIEKIERRKKKNVRI